MGSIMFNQPLSWRFVARLLSQPHYRSSLDVARERLQSQMRMQIARAKQALQVSAQAFGYAKLESMLNRIDRKRHVETVGRSRS